MVMNALVLLVSYLPLTNAQATEHHKEPPAKWSVEDDKQIRDSVRNGGRKTAMPLKGKWALFTVLIVPREIKNAYQKDKLATLKVLQSIVERGRPGDALMAAAYAIALAENPVRGAMYSSYPDEKIDERIEGRQETFRQILAVKMRNLVRIAMKNARARNTQKPAPT